MKASFNLAGKEVTVVRRISGVEEYYVNQNLVMKEKMSDCKAVRKLNIEGKDVTFNYEFCEPVEYYCQVLVDGKIFIRDLFPGFIQAKLIGEKTRKLRLSILILLVISVFYFFLG